MSKTVMLRWPSSRFEVTDEGYERIRELIKQFQVCPGCDNPIDDDKHRLVGKKCLTCVLADHPSYTFVGVQRESEDGVKTYAFTNKEGITLTSIENSSDSPQEDVAFSIESAGFVIPEQYKPFRAEEELELNRNAWTVYGKVSQSVIVLHYKDNNSKGRLEVDFLAYKKSDTIAGTTIPFNRRTTEHQNLLEKARKLATKLKRGTDDKSLFEIISRLETASYNEQLAFLAENPTPEHSQIELFTDEQSTTEQPAEEEPVHLETARQKRKGSKEDGASAQ